MSKINISGRSDRMQPRTQNIPLRTDLGSKLRAALIAQPAARVLAKADYAGLETAMLAKMKEEARGGR